MKNRTTLRPQIPQGAVCPSQNLDQNSKFWTRFDRFFHPILDRFFSNSPCTEKPTIVAKSPARTGSATKNLRHSDQLGSLLDCYQIPLFSKALFGFRAGVVGGNLVLGGHSRCPKHTLPRRILLETPRRGKISPLNPSRAKAALLPAKVHYCTPV